MGVSLNTEGASGKKKAVDAELNLIPFIDLLICCICFLLITAVWVQMAQIEVTQRGRGAIGDNVPTPSNLSVSVLVGDDGYTITAAGQRLLVPKQGPVYDTDGLLQRLKQVRSQLTETSRLTVAADDHVKYRHLVQTMDIARQSHFESIHLSDASSRL